jgi:quercetin dioxygenase-like cupin family protein
MRHLITGVDADGRSCVVAEHECAPAGDVIGVQPTFETGETVSPRPAGNAQWRDLRVAPGALRVAFVQWPPNDEIPLHHTDTIDVGTVLAGSIDVLLDDGPHHLELGDSVVMAGVDHGWRVGPAGATVAIVVVGTPPPNSQG